jgi:hypothetical protein
MLLDPIGDGLVESFFPILADFDDRIDELENACGVPKPGAHLEKSVICRPDAIFGTS